MNIKVSRAVKQPFTGRNWPVNLGIGAAVTLVAALAGQFGMLGGIAKFLLTALTAGYALRVMSNEAGSNEGLLPVLPEWTGWQDLFLRGITSTFVNGIFATVFALIVTFIGGALGAGAVGAMHSVTTAPSMAAFTGVGGLFMLVVFGLGLAFALVLVMLNVHYAAEGRITAFIEFGPALRRAFSKPGNTLVAGLVSLGIVAATAVIGFVPFIGPAVGSFVGSVALANLWAQVYRLGR